MKGDKQKSQQKNREKRGRKGPTIDIIEGEADDKAVRTCKNDISVMLIQYPRIPFQNLHESRLHIQALEDESMTPRPGRLNSHLFRI